MLLLGLLMGVLLYRVGVPNRSADCRQTAFTSGIVGADSPQGGAAPRRYLMPPLAGLLERQPSRIPALVALGHNMAALTGLVARTPIRYRIYETQYNTDVEVCE